MSDMPYIRARVSLLGHVSLGVVRLRYTDGGGIVLDDGRRCGPGAIYSIEPVPETITPTAREIDALEEALGVAISNGTGESWCIEGERTSRNPSIFMALAVTIDDALSAASAQIYELRERLAKAEAGDAMRAQRLLDAMVRLDGLNANARVMCSPSYAPNIPPLWSLSLNWGAEPVKGSLDDMITYILDKVGKPAPAPVEPVVDPDSGTIICVSVDLKVGDLVTTAGMRAKSAAEAPKSVADATDAEIPF